MRPQRTDGVAFLLTSGRRSWSAAQLSFLSFLGVFAEITCCVWALSQAEQLWMVPAVLLGYHSGYILSRSMVFGGSVRLTRVLIGAGGALMSLGIYYTSWVIILIGAISFSTALQALRRALKSRARLRTRSKNLLKIGGMLCGSAGVLPPVVLSLLVGLLAGVVPTILHYEFEEGTPKRSAQRRREGRWLLWFEFFHHAHYFAYCYVFWAILPTAYLPFVGPLFVIGWLAYFAFDELFSEHRKSFSLLALAAGHLVCAGALAGMALTSSAGVLLSLWFITGIGGGTAYMIGNVPPSGNRELYEDWGHIAGLVGCVSMLLISDRVHWAIGVGALYALLSVLGLLPGMSKRRRPPTPT